jgi:hypothetical protein
VVRDRWKAFRTNRETIFWLVCFIVFTGFLLSGTFPTIFARPIPVTPATTPGIVIIFSLITTAIWCYVFLLLPAIRHQKTVFANQSAWRLIFHFLFWSNIALNLLVLHLYLMGLTNVSSPTDPHSGEQAIRDAFSTTFPTIGIALFNIHLLLYLFMFACMDLIISICSDDPSYKNKFADVLVFVDIPMMGALLFIMLFLEGPLGNGYYPFEAGMIAFQLIAGSFGVIGLQIVEDDKKVLIARMASCLSNRADP